MLEIFYREDGAVLFWIVAWSCRIQPCPLWLAPCNSGFCHFCMIHGSVLNCLSWPISQARSSLAPDPPGFWPYYSLPQVSETWPHRSDIRIASLVMPCIFVLLSGVDLSSQDCAPIATHSTQCPGLLPWSYCKVSLSYLCMLDCYLDRYKWQRPGVRLRKTDKGKKWGRRTIRRKIPLENCRGN